MKTSKSFSFVLLTFFLRVSYLVTGHARLVNPPSRASTRRYGFDTPIIYNDNEGNCGGFTHQWRDNNGRCGVCGDSWSLRHRPHEAGGQFATGKIVRNYTAGQTITVTIEITANHKGFMEFRICPVDDSVETKLRECLNRNLITMDHKNKSRHTVAMREGYHHIALVLPKNMSCSRCVLQWRYVAGNNRELCPGGFGALGCGPQEEFRACANIAIFPRNESSFIDRNGKESAVINYRSIVPPIQFTLPSAFHLTKPKYKTTPSLASDTTTASLATLTSTISSTTERSRKICVADGYWRFVPGIKEWCNANCNHIPPYCPQSHCICS